MSTALTTRDEARYVIWGVLDVMPFAASQLGVTVDEAREMVGPFAIALAQELTEATPAEIAEVCREELGVEYDGRRTEEFASLAAADDCPFPWDFLLCLHESASECLAAIRQFAETGELGA